MSIDSDQLRGLLTKNMGERELESVVRSAAWQGGWWRYHTFSSKRSEPGWPDEVLVRGTTMILAELKRQNGRLTPDQTRVLEMLRQVERVEVHVWRPSDIDAIRERLLR